MIQPRVSWSLPKSRAQPEGLGSCHKTDVTKLILHTPSVSATRGENAWGCGMAGAMELHFFGPALSVELQGFPATSGFQQIKKPFHIESPIHNPANCCWPSYICAWAFAFPRTWVECYNLLTSGEKIYMFDAKLTTELGKDAKSRMAPSSSMYRGGGAWWKPNPLPEQLKSLPLPLCRRNL